MKKSLLIVLIFVFCITVFASDDEFVDALRNCSTYSSSGQVEVGGVKVKTNKYIQGWQNGECRYKETVNYNGMNIITACRFTKQQLEEIVSVADAYLLTLQYSNEEIDTSSLDSVKNNPFANVMNKYLNDSSVCSMSGLE